MARVSKNTIYWVRGDDERVNATYLLDVPVSGVTEGQVVRYSNSASAYVPALASGVANAADPRHQYQAVGVIININGSTGDLIISNGKLTGFSGLVAGTTYYLSQSESGSITSIRPQHGIIVTVGVAIDATTILVNIRIEESNPNILRGQPQNGCSNGQIVQWNGTHYVPVSAANPFPKAIGMITNITGGFGDVYLSGPAPTSATLVQGETYYLSTTSAGTITNTLPTGFVFHVGTAISTSMILLDLRNISIDSSNVLFSEIKPKDTNGLFVKNAAGTSTNVFIANNGNVCVGGTNPSTLLDIRGGGIFSSRVFCYRGVAGSSGDANYLSGLDGFYGSSYDGYWSFNRPGYSHAFWQHNHEGSVGTIQWSASYATSLYRRNRTDNTTWSSWRQVD